MKKRFISLVLCLCILSSAGIVYAAPGSGEDPLISLSYIENTYLPALRELISAAAEKALGALSDEKEEDGEEEPAGPRILTISEGGSISLGEGDAFILLSGSAWLNVEEGTVVNATTGEETTGGSVGLCCRYIVCENSEATVSILGDALVSVTNGAVVTQGSGKVSPFKDVTRADWFYADVVSAWEKGLVNGMSAAAYEPYGNLTVAQAIKLAACMHQLYHEGAVTIEARQGNDWYVSYVVYALNNGIISGEYANYNAVITRREFVKIFYKALPLEEYAPINTIADGAIPDVSVYDANAAEIYAFYRAGILTGYTGGGGYAPYAFGASSSITRAEVATIMNRMMDHSARRNFAIN